MQMFVCIIEIFLKIMIAELVSIFILAVFVGVDLNGVIGEVDELVLSVAQLILITAGSNVPLVVPVALRLAVLHKASCTNRESSI